MGISGEWDALFVSKLFTSFSTSARGTGLKEKLELHFLRIAFILEDDSGIWILQLKRHHYFQVFGKVNCVVL